MPKTALAILTARFRRTLRRAQFLAGLGRTVVAVLAFTTAAILLDWWLNFGWVARLAGGLGVLAVAGGGAWVWIVQPLAERWSDAQVLDCLDQTLPPGRRGLLYLAELVDGRDVPEAATEVGSDLLASARRQLEPLLGEVRVEAAVSRRLPRRWAGAAGGAAALAVLLAVAASPYALTGLVRLLAPWAEVPWPRKTRIAVLEPAGAMGPDGWATPRGEPFGLRLRMSGRLVPARAELSYRPRQGGRWVVEELPVGPDGTCRAQLAAVSEDLVLAVRAGDAHEQYRLRAVDRPALAQVSALYRYPIYTRLPPKRVDGGALSAIEGTEVLLSFTANQPLARAGVTVRLNGQAEPSRPLWLPIDAAGRGFAHRMALTAEGSYEVHLVGRAGFAQREPEVYAIAVLLDQPPTAEILLPAEDLEATPQGRCRVTLRAADDFGLTAVEVRYQVNGGAAAALSDRLTGPIAQQGRRSEGSFLWDLRSLEVKGGQEVALHVWAKDCNPSGLGAAESRRLRITVLGPTEFQSRILLKAKALLTEARTAHDQQKYAAIDLGHWLAGTRPDANQPLEPPELLKRGRAQQEYAARALQAVGFHLGQVQSQTTANQMQLDFMARRLDQVERMLPPLAAALAGIERDLAAGEPAAAAEAAPPQALAKMQTAVRGVQARQRQAAVELYRLYVYVADWCDLQNALVKTRHLAELQDQIHQATVRVTPLFKGKEVEDLDEKSVEELATTGQRQQAACEAERALEEELARLIVKSERERRRGTYVSLMAAFKGLKTHRVNDQMRQSAMAIADNRPHTILDVQQLALKGLTWVADGLLKAGQELQPTAPYTAEQVALILADDRLRAGEAEVVQAGGQEVDLTAAAVAEPADVRPAETVEYALQLWQERQAALLDQMLHVARKLQQGYGPRYSQLKMGMLAARSGGLEEAMRDARSRAAGHECKPLGPRIEVLSAETAMAIELTAAGRVGPAVQRIHADTAEAVKDLRRLLEARGQMLAAAADRKASGDKDAFGRAYLIAGEDVPRAAGMLEHLQWALVLCRDASRKARPAPADLPAEEQQTWLGSAGSAAGLLARMAEEVQAASAVVGAFAGPDAQRRLGQWAQSHLGGLDSPGPASRPGGDELARLEQRLRDAAAALKDLTDERLRQEVPVPQEERIPQAAGVADVKTEDLADAEVLARVQAELMKFETPQAVIARVQESAAIPDGCKGPLIESVRQLQRWQEKEDPEPPLDGRYRALVNAYFNAIAREK